MSIEEFEGYKVPKCTKEEVRKTIATNNCEVIETYGVSHCNGIECSNCVIGYTPRQKGITQRYLDHRWGKEKNEKIAVHCETQEEWDRVEEVMSGRGAIKPSRVRWAQFKEESCLRTDSQRRRGGARSYYEAQGYKIISAAEFLGEEKEERSRHKCPRCGSYTTLDNEGGHWAILCLNKECKQSSTCVYSDSIADAEEFWVKVCDRNKLISNKEEDMNASIKKVYGNMRTSNEVDMVNEYFGDIPQTPYGEMFLEKFKEDIFKKAKELKKEEDEANKKK